MKVSIFAGNIRYDCQCTDKVKKSTTRQKRDAPIRYYNPSHYFLNTPRKLNSTPVIGYVERKKTLF